MHRTTAVTKFYRWKPCTARNDGRQWQMLSFIDCIKVFGPVIWCHVLAVIFAIFTKVCRDIYHFLLWFSTVSNNKTDWVFSALSLCQYQNHVDSQLTVETVVNTDVSNTHHWDFSSIFPRFLNWFWAYGTSTQFVVVKFLAQSIHPSRVYVLPCSRRAVCSPQHSSHARIIAAVSIQT